MYTISRGAGWILDMMDFDEQIQNLIEVKFNGV